MRTVFVWNRDWIIFSAYFSKISFYGDYGSAVLAGRI